MPVKGYICEASQIAVGSQVAWTLCIAGALSPADAAVCSAVATDRCLGPTGERQMFEDDPSEPFALSSAFCAATGSGAFAWLPIHGNCAYSKGKKAMKAFLKIKDELCFASNIFLILRNARDTRSSFRVIKQDLTFFFPAKCFPIQVRWEDK